MALHNINWRSISAVSKSETMPSCQLQSMLHYFQQDHLCRWCYSRAATKYSAKIIRIDSDNQVSLVIFYVSWMKIKHNSNGIKEITYSPIIASCLFWSITCTVTLNTSPGCKHNTLTINLRHLSAKLKQSETTDWKEKIGLIWSWWAFMSERRVWCHTSGVKE